MFLLGIQKDLCSVCECGSDVCLGCFGDVFAMSVGVVCALLKSCLRRKVENACVLQKVCICFLLIVVSASG